MGQPRPLFHYFILSNTQYNFYITQMWNNVHPVNDAGIWTHNHWIVSLVFLFPSMLHFVANPLIRFFLFSLWASHKRVSVSLFLFQSYFFSFLFCYYTHTTVISRSPSSNKKLSWPPKLFALPLSVKIKIKLF